MLAIHFMYKRQKKWAKLARLCRPSNRLIATNGDKITSCILSAKRTKVYSTEQVIHLYICGKNTIGRKSRDVSRHFRQFRQELRLLISHAGAQGAFGQSRAIGRSASLKTLSSSLKTLPFIKKLVQLLKMVSNLHPVKFFNLVSAAWLQKDAALAVSNSDAFE